VHDHVIIGADSHFSARREGWFAEKVSASGRGVGESEYRAG